MTGEAVDKEDTVAAMVSDAKIRESWFRGGRGEGREEGTDSIVGFSASNTTVIPCSVTLGTGGRAILTAPRSATRNLEVARCKVQNRRRGSDKALDTAVWKLSLLGIDA
jgi:hypothetical protein